MVNPLKIILIQSRHRKNLYKKIKKISECQSDQKMIEIKMVMILAMMSQRLKTSRPLYKE
jgi:hypothetical protein